MCTPRRTICRTRTASIRNLSETPPVSSVWWGRRVSYVEDSCRRLAVARVGEVILPLDVGRDVLRQGRRADSLRGKEQAKRSARGAPGATAARAPAGGRARRQLAASDKSPAVAGGGWRARGGTHVVLGERLVHDAQGRILCSTRPRLVAGRVGSAQGIERAASSSPAGLNREGFVRAGGPWQGSLCGRPPASTAPCPHGGSRSRSRTPSSPRRRLHRPWLAVVLRKVPDRLQKQFCL